MGILFWAKCRMCFPHLSFSKMLLNLGTVNSGPWHLTVCVWLWHMSPDSPWVTYPLVKGLHVSHHHLCYSFAPCCTFSRQNTQISPQIQFSCSVMSDSFGPLWTAAHQVSLSITNSQSLLKLMSFEWVMPPNHLILCRPLLLLPSIIPHIRVFSNESVLHIR